MAGAGFLLLFLAPFFVLTAAAIKLDSPGPVFFRQWRYGKGGHKFRMYKFRTMTCTESAGAFVQAAAGDQRVTRIGRVLRSTSLDELPQLLNVLLGEMSLVGPRPHAIAMDEHFNELLPNYMSRYLVRPGITGLAQIAGCRGPTVSTEDMASRLRRDLVYVRRWSLTRDLGILAATPLSLRSPNAL